MGASWFAQKRFQSGTHPVERTEGVAKVAEARLRDTKVTPWVASAFGGRTVKPGGKQAFGFQAVECDVNGPARNASARARFNFVTDAGADHLVPKLQSREQHHHFELAQRRTWRRHRAYDVSTADGPCATVLAGRPVVFDTSAPVGEVRAPRYDALPTVVPSTPRNL
jgi:hypothetical protein